MPLAYHRAIASPQGIIDTLDRYEPEPTSQRGGTLPESRSNRDPWSKLSDCAHCRSGSEAFDKG